MRISNDYFVLVLLFALLFALAGNKAYAQYCAGTDTLTDSTATFHDGSNGAYYENNTDCKYLIQPEGEGFIILSFYAFMTEQDCDFLRIYDGTDITAPLLGEYSGWMTPPNIVSTDNALLLHFTSNDTITDYGWEVHYTLSNPHCSGTTIIDSCDGVISDGSEVENYDNYSDCLWLIQPTESPSYITLSFNDFETEQDFDYVKVYDGSTTDDPLLASYCGYVDTTDVPPDVSTTGGEMLVRFTTDESVVEAGWEATYTCTNLYCSGTTELNDLSGTFDDGSGPDDYQNNSDCKWFIHPMDEVSQITVNFNAFDVENTYDYVRIYQGSSTSDTLLGEYTGDAIPPEIVSQGNEIVVHFLTNETGTAPGWDITYSSIIDTLLVSPSNLNFSASANDSANFEISSNLEWTIESDVDWLSIMPENGCNDETIHVYTDSANVMLEPRFATISVSGEGTELDSLTIDVTQDAAEPYVDLLMDSIVLSSNAQSNAVFNVSSNIDWSITLEESWIFVTPQNDSANAVVTVTALDENTSFTQRETSIHVSGAGLNSQEIIVIQEGSEPFLSIEPSTLVLNSSAGSNASFNITSNVEWELSSNESWLALNPGSGNNNNTVTVLATTENSTTSSRIANITVAGTNGPEQHIQVVQQGVTPSLSVTPDTVLIQSNEGSEEEFLIISNVNWEIYTASQWLTIAPGNGTGNGNITLSSNSENTNMEPRIADLIVSGEGVNDKTVTVIQEEKIPFLDVSSHNITLNANINSSNIVNINTNVNWDVISNSSWFSVTPTSGINDTSITITTTNENIATDSRTDTITIVGDGISPVDIFVTQLGTGPHLSVSPTTLSISAQEDASGVFTITSNVNWTITDNQPWLDISPASGLNNSSIIVNANSDNPLVSNRTAFVVINSPNTNSQTVTVIQEGTAPELQLSQNEIAVNPQAGSFNTFDINSNIDWEIGSNEQWLTVSPEAGSGNNSITVMADSMNASPQARYGMLTISGNNISRTLIVKQEQFTLDVSTDSLHIGSACNDYDVFNLTSNCSWSISDNASWLVITPVSGYGNSTITATVTQNNPSHYVRYANITVANAYIDDRDIIVKQDGNTGIGKMSFNNAMVVYPNPVTNKIFIEVSDNVSGKIELINITGAILNVKELKKKNNSIVFNMEKFPSGVYLIKFITGEQVNLRKIIKR